MNVCGLMLLGLLIHGEGDNISLSTSILGLLMEGGEEEEGGFVRIVLVLVLGWGGGLWEGSIVGIGTTSLCGMISSLFPKHGAITITITMTVPMHRFGIGILLIVLP